VSVIAQAQKHAKKPLHSEVMQAADPHDASTHCQHASPNDAPVHEGPLNGNAPCAPEHPAPESQGTAARVFPLPLHAAMQSETAPKTRSQDPAPCFIRP
jgi:hypothetical protein